MARDAGDGGFNSEALGRLLRRAREPFASQVETGGFATAITTLVRAARHLVEDNPTEAGRLAAIGVRDEGALWYVGEATEETRRTLGHNHRSLPTESVAMLPARVFAMVAYRHPYFDGNKRTAFVAATLLGYYLGFEIRPIPFDAVAEEARELTSREAPEEDVREWLLSKVFISPQEEEV